MIVTIGVGTQEPRGRALSTGTEDEPAGRTWFRVVGDHELERAYRLAGFILGDAREAEDATQDALTRASKQRDQLRSLEQAQAWFDRILVNTCRYRLRRRRSGVRWVPIEAGDAASPRDPFAAMLARDAVLRGLDVLDADHRIVVILRFWAGLPLDEIAVRLAVPLGTVKSRLHYALRDLRGAIGPVNADETDR